MPSRGDHPGGGQEWRAIGASSCAGVSRWCRRPPTTGSRPSMDGVRLCAALMAGHGGSAACLRKHPVRAAARRPFLAVDSFVLRLIDNNVRFGTGRALLRVSHRCLGFASSRWRSFPTGRQLARLRGDRTTSTDRKFYRPLGGGVEFRGARIRSAECARSARSWAPNQHFRNLGALENLFSVDGRRGTRSSCCTKRPSPMRASMRWTRWNDGG